MLRTSSPKDLRVQVGGTVFPLTAGQTEQVALYRAKKAYDQNWFHPTTKGGYFVTMGGKRMPLVVQAKEPVNVTDVPKTISGTVVNNGGNYYAIRLDVAPGMLFDAALQYAKQQKLKGKYNHPISWTAYGTKPLGPHVSLSTSGSKFVSKKVTVKVGAWEAFTDNGSRWIALGCTLPKQLTCDYDCHISCAQIKSH